MKVNHDKVITANELPFPVFEAKYIPEELLNYTAPNGDEFNITFKDTHTTDTKPKLPENTRSRKEILDTELEACFKLIEQTSASDYAGSSLGWKPAAKRAEMREQDMRFLLLRRQAPNNSTTSPTQPATQDQDNSPTNPNSDSPEPLQTPAQPLLPIDDTILGFLSFMITIEENQDVLYIYEIHLSPSLRGQGLGKHLFAIAESIACATGMTKTMLTVFVSNTNAAAMYKKIGYAVDECSPRVRRLRGGVVKMPEYWIMSKRLGHGHRSEHRHSSGVQVEEGMRAKRRKISNGEGGVEEA